MGQPLKGAHLMPQRPQPAPQRRRALGFSLSELMVSVAVVGVIATLTVPVVMNNVQEGKKKAVFKETISAIGQIVYEGVSNGELEQGVDMEAYLVAKLNGVKTCTGAAGGACVQVVRAANYPTKGVQLSNGATIDFYDYLSTDKVAYIDWNGDVPPNRTSAANTPVSISQLDTLFLYMNTTSQPITTTNYLATLTSRILPGQSLPLQNPAYSDNLALYNWAMAN
jgi:prepilin-type N-terminal cleavage/methylation domain-containing protein